MPGGLLNQEINVISEVSAEVVEHNLPVAIKANAMPMAVEVHLKNTSLDEIWTSRRAALTLKGGDDTESVFYDPGDWIDNETVGVPVNQTRINPGETGIVKFTLDPRNVRPATYKLVFSMDLRDAEEVVYIDGAQTWERLIRVDR
jgi:hypothetical protein